MDRVSPRTMVKSLREREIARVRSRLCSNGVPRLQMAFLVALTGTAGLAASSILASHGFHSMASRYLVAVACAYVVFLTLLWLWLRTTADDYLDMPDAFAPRVGGGGPQSSPSTGGAGWPDDGGAMDVVGGAAEADELALPLFAMIMLGMAVAAAVAAAGVLVWTAPSLFAETAVDSALAASLYRRVRHGEGTHRHWLESAIRRTWWPFLATAVVLATAGAFLAHMAPGATTLWQAVATMRAG